MTLLPRLVLLVTLIGLAAAQANADNLVASTPPAKAKAKAIKTAKPAAPGADSLGGVKFSNPYGPPEGTTGAATPDFPAGSRPSPTEPKGDLSFTYKWRASNGWIDPYDAVRHSAPPDGFGDSFMGGVKLGF